MRVIICFGFAEEDSCLIGRICFFITYRPIHDLDISQFKGSPRDLDISLDLMDWHGVIDSLTWGLRQLSLPHLASHCHLFFP